MYAIDNTVPINRANVFKELLTTLHVALSGLKTVAFSFNVLLEKKEVADKLLSDRGIQLLNTVNLTVMVPSEIKAKSSFFVRQADQAIGLKSTDEIKTEIFKNHDFIKKCNNIP